MPHCYGYRFSYTLDVVWNTGPLPLAEVSSIRNNLIFAKKFILFILTTLVIIWVLIISKSHFYHMHVIHLDNDNTNEQPLRKIFSAYVKPPCTHLELLLLNDVEKIHMKQLLLTSTVQFRNFTARISPRFFTKLWSAIF